MQGSRNLNQDFLGEVSVFFFQNIKAANIIIVICKVLTVAVIYFGGKTHNSVIYMYNVQYMYLISCLLPVCKYSKKACLN